MNIWLGGGCAEEEEMALPGAKGYVLDTMMA